VGGGDGDDSFAHLRECCLSREAFDEEHLAQEASQTQRVEDDRVAVGAFPGLGKHGRCKEDEQRGVDSREASVGI